MGGGRCPWNHVELKDVFSQSENALTMSALEQAKIFTVACLRYRGLITLFITFLYFPPGRMMDSGGFAILGW
jgi:hypothetical protein